MLQVVRGLSLWFETLPFTSLVPQILQSGLETISRDGSSECQRDLIEVDDGSLRLEFTLSLDVFSVTWNQKVGVELKPVALEPIQIAEAKVQDLEERLHAIAAEAERDHAARVDCRVLLLEFESTNSVATVNGLLQWKRCCFDVSSKYFTVHPNGCVRVLTGGCYVVSLVVHHSCQRTKGHHFELRWGKTRDQFTVTSSNTTSLFSAIAHFEENSTLRVLSKIVTGIVKGTTLSIMPVVYA